MSWEFFLDAVTPMEAGADPLWWNLAVEFYGNIRPSGSLLQKRFRVAEYFLRWFDFLLLAFIVSFDALIGDGQD